MQQDARSDLVEALLASWHRKSRALYTTCTFVEEVMTSLGLHRRSRRLTILRFLLYPANSTENAGVHSSFQEPTKPTPRRGVNATRNTQGFLMVTPSPIARRGQSICRETQQPVLAWRRMDNQLPIGLEVTLSARGADGTLNLPHAHLQGLVQLVTRLSCHARYNL